MTFTQRIAAVVMLTIGGLGLYFMLAMFGGSSVAFADVAAKVGSARTLVFTSTITLPGKPPVETRMYVSDPLRMRIEVPGGNVIVHNGNAILMLNAKAHTAERTNFTGGAHDNLPGIASSFRELAKSVNAKKLGERKIDGVLTQGFEVTYENRRMTVWADAKTADPVRFEMSNPTDAVEGTTVMEHFQIDPALDDAVFSVEAPEGYKVTVHNY